jgi:hypothetical protein
LEVTPQILFLLLYRLARLVLVISLSGLNKSTKNSLIWGELREQNEGNVTNHGRQGVVLQVPALVCQGRGAPVGTPLPA